MNATGFAPDELYDTTTRGTSGNNALGFKDNNFRISALWNHDNFKLNFYWFEMNTSKNNNLFPDRGSFGNYWHSESLGIKPQYSIELNDTDELVLNTSLVIWDHSHVPRVRQRLQEFQYEARSVYKTTRFDGHSLALGALVNRLDIQGRKNFFNNNSAVRQDSDAIVDQWAVFAEDQYEVSDQLNISIGLRYDVYKYKEYIFRVLGPEKNVDIDEIDPHLSPRLAFSYEVNTHTIINLSYQQGYRIPNHQDNHFYVLMNELFTQVGGPEDSNKLEPEELNSYELNIKHLFSPDFKVDVNLFYNEFENLIFFDDVTVNNSPWSQTQIDAVVANHGFAGKLFNSPEKFANYGFETLLEYHFTHKTKAALSYAYTKTNRDIDNGFPQHFPSHTTKLNVDSKIFRDKLIASLNYTYRPGLKGSNNPRDPLYQKDFHQVDVSLRYIINDKMSCRLLVENLFSDNIPFSGVLNASRGGLGLSETRMYFSIEARF